MSGLNTDQLHRSTLGIYMSLMDQFNPSLQSLVALGNNYIQAFQVLAASSEAYFSALGKMGEQAMQTMSSHVLGDILIQISESQRRFISELKGVFRWFHHEVLQEMGHNIRLDKDYILDSRRNYEMEVRNQVMALERQMRRGGPQDSNEYVQFLRESQREALKEQERRYRFLAEKHCGLSQSIIYLMNKTGNSLQHRADDWREQVNQTRGSRPSITNRPEGIMADNQGQAWAEQPLGRVPSRAPSPQPTLSRSNSFGETRGSGGGRVMRALVPHTPSPNSTLLPFSKGETIKILVPQPRNGWLYGSTQSSARQGWFPATYVGPVDDTFRQPDHSELPRSSNSMSNHLNQPASNKTNAPPAPPPPPPPASKSNSSHSVTPTSFENKKQDNFGSRPELFPRGTNPFATVKLKPTRTNDRSAPRIS